jgi:hypothetical protein
MKRSDVQLFMLCNRYVPYLVDNEVMTPLQCGTAIEDNNVCDLKDNTEDNISHLNEFYLENTGVYWIWKNIKNAKYKGQTQYRRQFDKLQYFDYDRIFKEYDVIVAEPLNLPKTFGVETCTLEFHYKVAHNEKDLFVLEEIIRDLYPEYIDDYEKYIKNGEDILYSCGFIMKSEDYDKYCETLFSVLEEYRKRMNLNTIDDVRNYVLSCYDNNEFPDWTLEEGVTFDWRVKYQMRIGGSLAERFFTLYVFHNFKNIFFLPYNVKEDVRI